MSFFDHQVFVHVWCDGDGSLDWNLSQLEVAMGGNDHNMDGDQDQRRQF